MQETQTQIENGKRETLVSRATGRDRDPNVGAASVLQKNREDGKVEA
ncbi:MAG: hypothetical protein HC806_00145 [Anaerolineae bacterium]|nr:hypothetical protein [Anaerolineae bacterium]